MLRRAEAAALADMADGLELTARALERGDGELDERAMSSLWDLRDRLADLRRTRRASNRVVRHSLLWRARMAPVAHESESASQLDLLGGSCLLLTRTALTMSPPEGRELAPSIRELAAAVGDLATAPGAGQPGSGRLIAPSPSPARPPPALRAPRQRSPRTPQSGWWPPTSWRSPVSNPAKPPR